VKANVDALKPLQVGLAIFTHDVGHLAAWEFNLSDFDPTADPFATHSVAYIAGTVSRLESYRLIGTH
jgi:CCR4-NOT transcription complex subunit 7/8